MKHSEGAVKVWFAAVVITLLLFVGIGIFYFVSPRAGLEGDSANDEVLAPEGGLGEAAADPSLVRVNNFLLEPAQREIEGSVVNGDDVPYVNVQVRFALFNSLGEEVGIVADTASVVGPGDTWLFRITLPADAAAVRAELEELQAVPSAADVAR